MEGYQDDQGPGVSFIEGEAERDSTVQPGGEMTEGKLVSVYQYSLGGNDV